MGCPQLVLIRNRAWGVPTMADEYGLGDPLPISCSTASNRLEPSRGAQHRPYMDMLWQERGELPLRLIDGMPSTRADPQPSMGCSHEDGRDWTR